jgi:hypothetical protein
MNNTLDWWQITDIQQDEIKWSSGRETFSLTASMIKASRGHIFDIELQNESSSSFEETMCSCEAYVDMLTELTLP